MKIGFTGAHGTGKTTIIEMLAEKTGFNFNPSIARQLSTEGIKINQDGDDETQKAILEKQLMYLNDEEHVILDRTLLDGYAYTKYSYDRGNISQEVMDDVISALQSNMKKYDYIFRLPIEFLLDDDGVRSTDSDFQREIDENIVEGIKLANVNVMTLTGIPDTRLKTICNVLGQKIGVRFKIHVPEEKTGFAGIIKDIKNKIKPNVDHGTKYVVLSRYDVVTPTWIYKSAYDVDSSSVDNVKEIKLGDYEPETCKTLFENTTDHYKHVDCEFNPEFDESVVSYDSEDNFQTHIVVHLDGRKCIVSMQCNHVPTDEYVCGVVSKYMYETDEFETSCDLIYNSLALQFKPNDLTVITMGKSDEYTYQNIIRTMGMKNIPYELVYSDMPMHVDNID